MRRFFGVFLIAALGCVQHYDFEEADVVYIIPSSCMLGGELISCERGDYAVDTPFQVVYEVGVGGAEFDSGTCSIEQIGEFELEVHVSWRSAIGPNEHGVGRSFLNCDDMTPPLAAGIWTIHHGGGSTMLEIPGTQVDTACVLPFELDGHSCAELMWGE